MSRSKLNDIGLPSPPENLEPLQESRRQRDQAQLQEEVIAAISKFNHGQHCVFIEVAGVVIPGVSTDNLEATSYPLPLQCTSATDSHVFFLDAPRGTGRTFVTRTIQGFLEMGGEKVKSIATSAVAAQLLDGGRTAHSTFKIPIPCSEYSTCNININSDLTQQLRQVSLISGDEIFMCHRYCLEAVNRTLRDITGINLPFCGKCVLPCVDFRQILPVIPGGSRAQIVNACLRSSHLYNHVKPLRLSENMRLNSLQQDPNADAAALQFPFYLLQVGEGRVADIENDRVHLPEPNSTCTEYIRTACNPVFEGMAERHTDEEWLMGRTVLTTENVRL